MEIQKSKKIVNNQGITLVALVVTIVIMLILAGITLNMAFGDNGLFKMAKSAVESHEESAQKEEDVLKELEKDMNDADREINNLKGVNRPKLSNGMIPIKYDNVKQKWVITNEDDNNWYEYKDIDPDKGINNLAWANVMLSDGTYKASAKGKPDEEGGYTDDGTTEVEEDELGSMFVWIPRFAYSITKYHTDVASGEGTTQKIFDVSFIQGTGSTDFEGNRYGYSYDLSEANEGQPTPKVVHSAFSFGGNNLTGIWVAKFEASTTRALTTNNNKTVADGYNVKVLPNAETWRYINIGNMFMNCLNMNKTDNIYGLNQGKTDSHLMKNTEWGAVAYLSASQYGVVPTINNKSSQDTSGQHEWAGGQDYVANVSQSTTGNVTGIYDMCGGGWECVAAYYDNGTSNLSGQAKDVFETNNTLKTQYEKYWNKYEVGDKEKTTYRDLASLWNKNYDSSTSKYDKTLNPIRQELTKDKYDLMKNHIGDAGYEVIKDGNYSYYGVKDNGQYDWILISNATATGFQGGKGYYNSDYALIGHCALPFVTRGGHCPDGVAAGVFAWDDGGGSALSSRAFRPVLVV